MVQQFTSRMSPLQEHAQAEIGKNRQKQQNIEQSGFLNQVLGGISEMGEEASLENVLQRIYGSNLSPENKQTLGKQLGDHYSKKEIEKSKKSNQQEDLSVPIKALDTLEDLVSKPGIGYQGSWNYSDEARKNRGIFESTQSGLLPLFKKIFPRMTNYDLQIIQEHYIPQAGDTEEKIRGKIQGLRGFIGQKSGSGEGGQIPGSPEGFRSQNEKPQGRESLEDIFK